MICCVQDFDFFMLPLLDRIGDQAGFFVGIGRMTISRLIALDRIVNGFGLGMSVRHDVSFFGKQYAAMQHLNSRLS